MGKRSPPPGSMVACVTGLDDNPFARDGGPAMFLGLTKRLIRILGIGLTLSACAQAQCPVDTIVVKGSVENANSQSTVRVQLVFPKHKPGESGEVTVEDGAFQIPIEFVTAQSSIFTNLPTRCGRKPKTVIITLLENDQQSDQVFLDFAKNFRQSDPSAYTLRSKLVLNAAH
jgi:hypothetical protein